MAGRSAPPDAGRSGQPAPAAEPLRLARALGRAALLLPLLAVAPGIAAAGDSLAGEGGLAALMPEATPMVMKDGRIAEVTVRAIPFDTGIAQPTPTTAAMLRQLAEQVATDCFLTAQAIGHVLPGVAGDGDTLAAHAIARARAESVQAILLQAGLPASAVASVWDWQFMLREPRVTLWLFRLPPGEACSDKPLRNAEAQTTAHAAAPRPVPKPTGSAAVETTTAAAQPPPPDGTAATERPQLLPLPNQADAEDPAGLPAPAAGPPTAAETEQAVLAPEPAPVASRPTAAAVLASAEIAFEANSSFFPRDATKQLDALVAGLPRDRGYEFEVLATVGGANATPKASAQPNLPARYDRWLAERRLARVGDWLEQHAEIRNLVVKRGLIEGDASHRVMVKVRPLS